MRTLTVTEEQYDMILDGLAALENKLRSNKEVVDESFKIKYKYGCSGIDDRMMMNIIDKKVAEVHRCQMELFNGEGRR